MTNLIIIDSEQTSRELIASYLQELDGLEGCAQFDNISQGLEHVLKIRPEVVIIDVSTDLDLALEAIKKINSANKSCKIITISYDFSTELMIKVMRAGAKDLLRKPIIKEEIAGIVNNIILYAKYENPDEGNGRVISVFSNKGGVGKTSVAVNLAYEIAEITQEKVALVDLNLQLGDVSNFLVINPSFNLSQIVNNSQNKTEEFVLSILENYKSSNLYVLADPSYIAQSDQITDSQIQELLKILKNIFSYIIIDTSSNMDVKTTAALDISDVILLIASVNLPSIRNIQRCLDLFEKMHYDNDKVKIVLNRFIENEEIKLKDVEDAIHKDIYYKIPNNYFNLISAINRGICVSEVNSDSNIAQAYKELAFMLTDSIISAKVRKKLEQAY